MTSVYQLTSILSIHRLINFVDICNKKKSWDSIDRNQQLESYKIDFTKMLYQ